MPPEANAEVVCAREDPLAVYPRPDEGPRPLVGWDDGTKPWGPDVRTPLPAEAGRPERLAEAYERPGTGNRFLRFAPLAGRREGLGTERRTAVDDAEAIQPRLDGR